MSYVLYIKAKCDSIILNPCLSCQVAVWNSYKGMTLMEKPNRDKNNNVTDSMANRTLIVTTIQVKRKNK